MTSLTEEAADTERLLGNRDDTATDDQHAGAAAADRDANSEPTTALTDATPAQTATNLPEVAERLQRKLADDVVNRLVLHDDRPIEHLPTLTAPELKLIGRCVSFALKQTINGVSALYYYTGIVSAITSTTVALLHVNRYSEADFKAYRTREKRMTSRSATLQHDFTDGDCTPQSLIMATTADPHTAAHAIAVSDTDNQTFPYSLSDVFGSGFGAGFPSAARADPLGSLAPAVKMPTGNELQTLPATPAEKRSESQEIATAAPLPPPSRPPHFRNCSGSVGPLYGVTFLRKSLQDVQCGRDPQSVFYALFRKPANVFTDMQFLRVLVRRYLVHTSENNNTSQVSVFAYLTMRGGYVNVDRELVERVVREELLDLMKHDRAIAKERRRMRNREARREEALRGYRAPDGIFADTGFLYLTGLPQGSLLTAATLLFFTLAFAGNYIVTVEMSSDNLIKHFCKDFSDAFMASLLVWTLTAMVIFFHALNMRVPSLKAAPVLLMRVMTAVMSGLCGVLCIVLITQATTNETMQYSMETSSADALCSFYRAHQCSGFMTACDKLPANDTLCMQCRALSYPTTACYQSITEQLQRIMIPLFLFSIVIFLTAVHSLFLVLKLFMVGRAASLAAHI